MEADLWNDLFGHMHELFQSEPTRRVKNGGVWSRLDRTYSSLHSADLRSMQIGANILPLPPSKVPLSDHSPLFTSICDTPQMQRSPFTPRIPDAAYRDPRFPKLVDEIAAEKDFLHFSNPWLGFGICKGLF